MLSRAHLAIDRLGWSLAAEHVTLEEERRSLVAALLQVHEARQAREDEWQRAAEETASRIPAARETAVEEYFLASAENGKELAVHERELTLMETEQRTERARLEQLDEGLTANVK